MLKTLVSLFIKPQSKLTSQKKVIGAWCPHLCIGDAAIASSGCLHYSMVNMRIIRFMTRWRHLFARRAEILTTLTVLNEFGLSHVLRALSHAGATMRQLDTPER